MAGSRDAVKFHELLTMSAAGSDALQEYINGRIEDVDGKGPSKLRNLLGHIQQQLNEKPNRKDSTTWLLNQDEDELKKLLGGTRKRLAMPEKPQDQTLALERMRAEILAAMMEYVLAKGQKQKHTTVSPFYVQAINDYGTDADRALLVDAGLRSEITLDAFSAFFGMGEKEAVKRQRVRQQHEGLKVVLKQATKKADTLGYAVGDLAGMSAAFAGLFKDQNRSVDSVIDDLMHFASDADKMDSMNNESLVRIAASLEQTASFINKLIHEIGVLNDPPLGQRLQLYRQLQVIAEQLHEKQQKLAGIMLERLKFLDENVLLELKPEKVDFSSRYECDKRMEEWKKKLRTEKALDLFREQANKMADEDPSKKGKRIDMIDVAGIIKFQAYIAKSGTTEQKNELIAMQAADLSASPSENWLQTKLKLWNMECPAEIQHFILGIQEKHHYFETQADLEVLRTVLQTVLGYKDRRMMLGVLRDIDERNLITDGNGYREFSQLMDHFKLDSSFGLSGDKTLASLVAMCDDGDDLSSVMSGINHLDEKQKTLFMRFLAMQDSTKDPSVPMIADVTDVYRVFSVLEEGSRNPKLMELYHALIERFQDANTIGLLKLLDDCAKLSNGTFAGDMLVSPQLILDVLPQVESVEMLLPHLEGVVEHLESAPLLQDMYQYFGLSQKEVNAIIKDVYQVNIEKNDNVLMVIQAQKEAIGELCLKQGHDIFADLVEHKLINFDVPGAGKDAAREVMVLMNSVNKAMNYIADGENDYEKLLERMNEMLEEIVVFKSNFKDKGGASNTGADAIINDLIDKLAPVFNENSDLKMVLYVNLVKAVARTPSYALHDGKELITSTLDLSSKYHGDRDGEQKLLKLATQSLRCIHSPQDKGNELKQTLKSLQEFGASAVFKRTILRFVKNVLSLIGKIIKPAAKKSEEVEKKVRFFDAKATSAAVLKERLREVDESQSVPSSRKPDGS